MITVEEMDHIINQVCGYLEDDPKVPEYIIDGVEKVIRRIVSEQKDLILDKMLQKLMQRVLVLEKKVQILEEN